MSMREQYDRPRPAAFRFSHKKFHIRRVSTVWMKNHPLLGAQRTRIRSYQKDEYENKSHLNPPSSCNTTDRLGDRSDKAAARNALWLLCPMRIAMSPSGQTRKGSR